MSEQPTAPREDEQAEEWRTVDGFPRYQVSTLGRVRRRINLSPKRTHLPQWRYLRGQRGKSGHRGVKLASPSEKRRVYIHHLVLNAFVGPCPPGMECCHADDNPGNNRLDNLRWDTHANNMRECALKGRNAWGTKVKTAKLNEVAVTRIRARVAAGETQFAVAADEGVCQQNVSMICSGKRWKRVAGRAG